MTIKLAYPRKTIIRLVTITLILVAGLVLAGCAGAKSSAPVVSQGATSAKPIQSGNADSAVLSDLHGTTEVKIGDGTWTLAQAGQILKSGQHLRTGALSNATLIFYDSSRLSLGAETEITLAVIDAPTTGARVVQVTQVSGESRHEVAQSADPNSQYTVNTPVGNGSATGTQFTVSVLPGRQSQFRVDDGEVSVVNANGTVVVVAGQTTTSLVGQPPTEPALRISGEGEVMQIGTAGNGGVVATPAPVQSNPNGKITLCHATGSTSNPYVTITVSTPGATHGHEQHAGDLIPAPAAGCPPSIATVPTEWTIGGQTFQTGANTIIFGNPQIGDWVSFEGYLLPDGSRFADRIVLLNHSSASQFAFIGTVESISTTVWIISGRAVQVTDSTAIEAGIKVSDSVQVAGSVTADGVFRAARINRTEGTGSNFRFAGILSSISSDIWIISGIKVTIDVSTTLKGDFAVGNPVTAQGVIKPDGTWLATSIELVTPAGYHFEFTGVVDSLSPSTVSGVSFDVAAWTEIDAGLKVGDKVRVAGTINADGRWVAEQIERLDTEHATSFDFFGPVISMNPWNVRGISLTVDARTTIKGDIALGEMVKVTGWILPDGTWLATEIKHTGLHLGQGCFWISGVVQSLNGDEIILTDGQTLVRLSDLIVIGDLKKASLVRYQYCVDKDGVGTIVRIVVVYQWAELPPVAVTGKAVICHIPSGNPGNRHTLEVGQAAVSAHLAHGDTLGPCPADGSGIKPKKDK